MWGSGGKDPGKFGGLGLMHACRIANEKGAQYPCHNFAILNCMTSERVLARLLRENEKEV